MTIPPPLKKADGINPLTQTPEPKGTRKGKRNPNPITATTLEKV